MSIDPIKETWTLERVRNLWEYKLLSIILRGMIACVVVIYLLFSAPFLWAWIELEIARHYPPEHFEVLLAEAEKSGDYEPAIKWLGRRPRDEAPLFAPAIDKNSAVLPPGFFMTAAHAARLRGDQENTQFWMMLTRYRMRYDLIRCGNDEIIPKVSELMHLLERMQGADNELSSVDGNPQRTAQLLRQVLAYDAEHPARNDPRLTCESIRQITKGNIDIAPPEVWANVRHMLRKITEDALTEMEGAPASKESATPP